MQKKTWKKNNKAAKGGTSLGNLGMREATLALHADMQGNSDKVDGAQHGARWSAGDRAVFNRLRAFRQAKVLGKWFVESNVF